MKVALVHDWLIHMRGGEKVLEALAEVFPDATIYTLFSNRENLSPSLQCMKIKTSLLEGFPGIRLYYRWLLPLLPFFIRTLKIDEADLVISSSHCVAKGIQIPRGAYHVCYCHTPMRYLWGFEEDYFGNFPKWLLSFLAPIFDGLRKWDMETSRQVNAFLCNSENVRNRIQRVYGREAEVIHPPVNTETFNLIPLHPNPLPYGERGKDEGEVKKGYYYLIVSALTPYKRIDIAIRAFNGWNRKLQIVGDGPSKSRYASLVQTANIRFLGKVSDRELKRLYREAKAVLFPQEEDFGIVPLEAQACGTPVIAFARGGALETVEDGFFFHEQTPEALRQAVIEFEKKSFDPEALRRHVLRFDKEEFKNKIRRSIENVVH